MKIKGWKKSSTHDGFVRFFLNDNLHIWLHDGRWYGSVNCGSSLSAATAKECAFKIEVRAIEMMRKAIIKLGGLP